MSDHHHHCTCFHERVRFCARCRVPYCMDCGKEWAERCTWPHWYPHWYTPLTSQTTVTFANAIDTGTCDHTNGESPT